MEADTPIDDESTLPADVDGEDLAARIDRLARERDEAVSARQRALADFANFQRRSVENESRARTSGLVSLARSLMPVLDQFDLALAQDASRLSVEQMAKSIEMMRAELQKVLEQNGIARIDPAPGSPFDPNQHDAVMRQPAAGIAPGAVSMRFQTGWRLGESVLRPAKVAVAPEA